MDKLSIVHLIGADETYRLQAIRLFIDGFRHVFSFAKDDSELEALFGEAFDYSMIYVSLYNDKVVGVLALGTNKKRVFRFNLEKCCLIFGQRKGRMLYRMLRSMGETPAVKNDNELYIDYLTTDKTLRGMGIASSLLDFACQLPDYDECHLEVLSKNVTAKSLYEKVGFTVYKKSFNFFTVIQGLGYPIKMKKRSAHRLSPPDTN